MITEEEIQQKAKVYADQFWRSVSRDTSEIMECGMWDTAMVNYGNGYRQCQQDMLNGNVLIGQMEYNRLVRKAENVKTTE